MFRDALRQLLDCLYPPVCPVCRSLFTSDKPSLCFNCQNLIKKNKPPFCARCSRYLADSPHRFCRECRRRKPRFDYAWASAIYDDHMKNLIHLFKYGQKTALRHSFVDLLSSFIDTYSLNIQRFDYVVPIPLHSTRLRERGYNQSQLLAEGISQKFRIALSCNNIQRIRHTPNQALLTRKERFTNIQGAFRISRPLQFKNRNCLLIDDLLTTGATASETARVLKAAGAKKVGLLTVAIAV